MRKRSILLLAGAFVLVASLVIGPAATAGPDRQAAGTVIFGHDQEPSTLNPYITEGNNYPTPLAINPVLAYGMIYNNKATLVAYLMDGVAKIVKKEPLTVSFKYKQSAVWSDGKPVTGNDFLVTYRTIMDPNWDITSRDGWQDIASVKAKGKAVTVTWKKGKAYSGWDALVATSPMPAHKVAGQNFNDLWRDSMDISSGPFKFQSWQKGTQLTLVKNPAFKAGTSANLDRIVFRYIPSTPSEFQALKSGEIDVMEPQPQLQIKDFFTDSKFKVQISPGYQWQHLDIQTGPKGHPALKKKYVRQALAQGINRRQIINALFVTPGLVKSPKDLPVLQSNIFKNFEPYYKPNWARWGFSQKNVIALLKKNGCTGGPDKPSASNSDIWSCPGVDKLSFRFTTTSGNQFRALAFEIMQKQLKSVGIELLPRFGPNTLVFGQVLPSGDWDLFLFTWISSPSGSATSFTQYGCGGGQNYMNYCNKKASALYNKANFNADPVSRAQQLNAAETITVEDVNSIPLWMPPIYVLNNKKVSGTVLNPTQQGSTWNAETWKVTR